MNNEEKIRQIEHTISVLDLTIEAYRIELDLGITEAINFLKDYIHLLKLEQEYGDE